MVSLTTVFVAALPLILLGYLVAFRQKRHWINGVDQSKLSNPDAFGKFVGNSITVTGMLIILITIFLYLKVIGMLIFAVSLVVVSFLPLPSLYYAKRKYS